MTIAFTKMQALGNDFVVIDAIRQDLSLTAADARRIADRHFGIGCDQILLVEEADDDTVDFRYRVFNADGGEVAQCGNGARCFARFVRQQGLTDKREIRVATATDQLVLRVEADDQVTVGMGEPQFEPGSVPIEFEQAQDWYRLELAPDRQIQVAALSLGNPHAVQLVDDVELAPVARDGPLIETHPRFPQRANAGYCQILARDSIRVRVFERGSGETLACGSGAAAAAVVGRREGRLDECVRVTLRGGSLKVCWAGDGHPVWLTGPAYSVYQGQVDLGGL